MTDGLHAIPALVGALITVIAIQLGVEGFLAAMIAAVICFLIRILGISFNLNAPRPPDARGRESTDGSH